MRPARYKSLNTTQSYRYRGTYQQTDTGMLWLNPTASAQAGPEGKSITTRMPGIAFGFVQLTTRGQGTAIVGGIGVRIPNDLWQAGTWTDLTTTYAQKTAFQGTTTAQAFDTLTNGDGIVVLSRVPFNVFSMNVTTAEGGATLPARDFSYTGPTGWIVASTSAQAATNMTVFDNAAALAPTGEFIAAWDPFSDWTVTADATYGSGLPPGYYGVRMRSTTAPGGVGAAAGSATGMEIGFLPIESPGPTGGLVNTSFSTAFYQPVLSNAETQIPYGDGIVALFSQNSGGTTQAGGGLGNAVDAAFRIGIV